MAFWKTIPTCAPRTLRTRDSGIFSRSWGVSPWGASTAEPATRAFPGSSTRIERIETLLPLPDSPTIASAPWCASEISRSWTTSLLPLGSSNPTRRPELSRSGALAWAPALAASAFVDVEGIPNSISHPGEREHDQREYGNRPADQVRIALHECVPVDDHRSDTRQRRCHTETQ